MAPAPDAPLHLLLDPQYWRPRLEQLKAVPRHLVVTPRPDYARPGMEVAELRLRAHDGQRLHALLCRPCFGCQGDALLVQPCAQASPDAVDWSAVEDGTVEVLFEYPPERRLEDRVLDVIRVFQAACSIDAGEAGPVLFGSFGAPGSSASSGAAGQARGEADELFIVSRLHERGWIERTPGAPAEERSPATE